MNIQRSNNIFLDKWVIGEIRKEKFKFLGLNRNNKIMLEFFSCV